MRGGTGVRDRVPTGWRAQLALLVGTFLVVTVLAVAFGAANLGTAATFGEIAFAIVLVAVLLLG